MAKVPDKAEHQRRFSGLEAGDRRAIIRAVNRGRAVDERRLAPLAVGVARRQAKFWRVAWVLGPVVGLAGLFGDTELMLVLLNAAVATVALGLMSWFWYSRARRAESLNLGLTRNGLERERGRPTADEPSSAGRRARSHLPGAAGGSAGAAGGSTGAAEPMRQPPGPPPPPGQRPYKPRRRKRR